MFMLCCTTFMFHNILCYVMACYDYVMLYKHVMFMLCYIYNIYVS